MKLSKHVIVLLMAGVLIFSSCSQNRSGGSVNLFPPESEMIRPDGSVPPGFYEALKAAGVLTGCITCNSQNRYGPHLKSNADDSAEQLNRKLIPFLKELDPAGRKKLTDELEGHIMWAMVRGVLIEGENNNLGAIVVRDRFWTDGNGVRHPLVIFRAAFTPSPSEKRSCYRSLLECASVKHVVNLYDGEMELNDLIRGEMETAEMMGATYVRTAEMDYGQWRDTIRKHPENGPEKEEASRNLARLIREQILMPGGEAPRGNILVHCGGGMHRTGMVIGIIQKVINGESMDSIKKSYGYHVGYRGEDDPGGFEQGNLDFIAGFPPELLLK